MGLSEQNPIYSKVHATTEVEGGIPMASAVSASGFGGDNLPTAQKIDSTVTEQITWEKGEVQNSSTYRDKWFAVTFISHLLLIVGASIALGSVAWEAIGDGSDDLDFDIGNEYTDEDALYNEVNTPPASYWWTVVIISLISAPALSICALSMLKRNAIASIKCSLWFSIILCGLSSVLLFSVSPLGGVMFGVLTGCLFCYQRAVKSRIPYAASNLKTGIQVLQNNLGLTIVSLGSFIALVIYCFCWVMAFAGTMSLNAMQDYSSSQLNSSEGSAESGLSTLGGVTAFLFVLCFYWTHQVLMNVVRCTVSGVAGTWWFSVHEASSFCSLAVRDSLVRSTTYSLGSICFGSLLVAILHAVRNSLRGAQNNRNGNGILTCIAACLLSYIEALVEYFNKWAFIYVGLYGYSYIESGKRVIALFKARGWDTIIADNLVNRLLGIMSLSIGLVTGVAALFASFVMEEIESKSGWVGLGFGVGFIAGTFISSVFMTLTSSAVDCVIVLFAEAPEELNTNHPAVAEEMHRTWKEAWPQQMNAPVAVDLNVPGVV